MSSTKSKKGQIYMRQYSDVIRVLSKNSYKTVKEDPALNTKDKK